MPDFEDMIRNLQNKLRNLFGRNIFSFSLMALIIFSIWLASGIYRVLPDEQGVVVRFGAFHRTTSAGLHYHMPWPIEDVYTPKVTIINRVDIGLQFFPSQTLFGARSTGERSRDVVAESLMLTGDENIVDVDFSVLWYIKSAKDFLFNIQNPTQTVKATAESTMREIVGKNNIQPILTEDRQRIEDDVKFLMQKTLDDYGAGIFVSEVKMQKVDPPGAVIDAFRDVQAARADQERLRNEAQAYRNRVVPEAHGNAAKRRRAAEAYREQTVAEAEGEAFRFLAIYNEYRKANNVTRRRLYLEAMEQILRKADKIIIDSKNNSGVVPYLPLESLQKRKAEGK